MVVVALITGRIGSNGCSSQALISLTALREEGEDERERECVVKQQSLAGALISSL